MQSYSAIIICSIVASLAPNDLLTPNGYKFYDKILVKYYFVKIQTHFFRIYFSLVVTFFLKLWLTVCTLLNVFQLGFNIILF